MRYLLLWSAQLRHAVALHPRCWGVHPPQALKAPWEAIGRLAEAVTPSFCRSLTLQ